MKKIILTAILFIALVINLSAQVKVDYYLTNARYPGGTTWLIDLYATVPAGQTWKAGPTCIRIDYWTVPDTVMAMVAANPVDNANPNLSNTAIYNNITTTSIAGTAPGRRGISLNILPKYNLGYYQLNPGSYLLGTLKFNVSEINPCINMAFITTSAIFDQMAPLTYSTNWTKTDPPPCIVGIEKEGSLVPEDYSLSQNYPNPFNPVTNIKFAIPTQSFVKLTVFDILGKEITTLVNETKSPGNYIVDFDASTLSSGIYYYRLETKDFTDTKKMMLIK